MNETKYDQIGDGYNKTRMADKYLTERLTSFLQPQADKAYLDIGCGTGNYTAALASKGINITGVDPSEKMLEEAARRHPEGKWVKASAEHVPVEDGAYKGAIATLTIHHWSDIPKAFAEISRVLSHKGRLVMFTATPKQMESYWLNHYFPDMLKASIAQMPSLQQMEEAAIQAGLAVTATEEYFVKDDLQDCFLYIGKNNPKLYFDEEIRKGISSFASLAHKEEVTEGLQKLNEDIQTVVFESVKERYHNDSGDYLFVVFEKK
ncbi:class I SAM-dependent methyltransferase [Pedobacter panaciterrae]|uniref:class I SAM-dependent methyltransferase n=1 Tax=Pedobacter panaciterrae TaxID=363849 RepID=UPI002594DC9B|nr:class I SAM-dependent methyltransferase [uncultured Pedobacter sp.]